VNCQPQNRASSQVRRIGETAGGSGALGTASVVRAEANGYTVLFAPAVVLSVLPQSRNDTGYRHDSLVPVCQTFVNNRQRRLAAPAFHAQRLADYGGATVRYTERMLESWHPGDLRDVHVDTMGLTLRIAAKARPG
jgi:cytochrome P450